MDKRALIARVQRHMGIGSNRASAQAAVAAVLSSIALRAQSERIELRGFGVFSHKVRPARNLRHPQSGEMISLAARSELCFRASSKGRA